MYERIKHTLCKRLRHKRHIFVAILTKRIFNRTWLLQYTTTLHGILGTSHDDVIKWTHFPRYWPFVRGIHRSPVNSPHKGQWRGALMFTLICTRIKRWVNNREAGDLRRYRGHYDVTVMVTTLSDVFMNISQARYLHMNIHLYM